MNVDAMVREWIDTRPGVVEAPTAEEAVRKCWGMCGLACSVETFREALWRAGYGPVRFQRFWRLSLPGGA